MVLTLRDRFKLYGISGAAFVILTICIVLEIIVFLDQKNLESNFVQSIEDANGFTSNTSVDNVASVSTSVTGLTSGEDGKLVPTPSNAITSVTLTGFEPTPASIISVSDTMVQAMGKLIVSKQTQLEGYQALPISNKTPLASSSTIMDAFKLVQSQISASVFMFVGGSITVAGSNSSVPIWGPILSGSTTFPAQTLFPGCQFTIVTNGSVTITGGSPRSVRMSISLGNTVSSADSDALAANTYSFTFTTSGLVREDGVTCTLISTFNTTNATAFSIDSNSVETNAPITFSAEIALSGSGFFPGGAVTAGTNIVTNSTTAFFSYRVTA